MAFTQRLFRCSAHALDIKHPLLSRGRLVRVTGQDRENKSDDLHKRTPRMPQLLNLSRRIRSSAVLSATITPTAKLPSLRREFLLSS